MCNKRHHIIIKNAIICTKNTQKVIFTIFIWVKFTDTLSVGVIQMNFQHSDKYRKFGLNVAYYRKDRRFTQEGLAEAVGADRSTIAKIENAPLGASLDMLFSIADALGIEPCKLLEFRD